MKPIPGNNEFSPSELYVDRSSDLKLGNKEYIRGLIRCTFYSFIAIMIFFVPLTINGETEILFGYIYKYLIELFGIAGIWMIAILTLGNACASIYGKFFAHENTKVYQYFKDDTLIHLFIYSLGAFYAILFTLHTTFPGFTGPEMIVGGDTGGVMSSIAVQVFWIIPLGAIFIPLILKYGGIDFVGTLMQPIMRPVFKVPGKSAVDAVASFVSSSSVAVIITSNLYKSNEYTRREAATIATSFSAVSIGFAAVVISTAGLMDHFLKVYFSSFLIAFIVSAVMVRLPPLSKKADVFHNGKEQSVEERLKESKFDRKIMKKAVYRAAENGYKADNVFKETGRSLKDGLAVLPKVLCMLTAIGVTCLIIAEYTPIFNWIGLLFVPILQLFVVPNAMEIAPAITVGLAEMFLPVLMIADLIGTIDIKAAYFITALSMVQIIFFSETGAVMLSTKLPVKVKDLVIIFFMRTLIAIPVVALFMHILF
ncbi:nucleoside recognition membrane protein YjiH [Evansella vedderi]|uniref:Nucleoside recognition membrane protein YjiH n=1 Tax=Evansella vedderi TaxID=38282 RepID=A0ABT9ZP43_9BACI|nr:YjiH family protein [Evansella vedderi]MDQ0253003.1 nucleoside recognition membrane protein YjiH [Evansella vedderi]